jgi:hypothetical protein
MTNPPLNLSTSDFDPLPEQPLRSARFWVGKAVAVPLWLALAVAYVFVSRD